MKHYTLHILTFLAIVLYGCKKEEIFTFTDGHELFFEKFYRDEEFPGTGEADSTKVSFFFYPDNAVDAEAPLVVNLSGKMLTTPDLKFGLKVIPEETTANSDEYTIDPAYSFRPIVGPGTKEIKDTIYVKLHRSARLDQKPDGVKLVVELVPNSKVGVGQTERIRAKIILTTLASQPAWWNSEVTSSLLGTYSQKKFKLFLNEIDTKAELNEDFIKARPDEAKKMALQFKKWLYEQSPRILEDNGSLMDVAL